ncbi:hypothetical protein [Massilia niastensis]|uniref:hypothetical protein n=1 Tax=Massilia niastensis TaxID=544911 RepID=UPI00037CB01E|nr:hypothetical protein [Massilia niastensis]
MTAPAAWSITVFEDRAPSGAHYRQNAGEPVCTVTNLVVSCTGTQIAGVGNNDADVRLTVSYSATVQCRNRGGQIVEVKTQSTSSTPAPDDTTELRNGTLVVAAFSAQNVPSNQAFENLAVCPNGNWTKVLLGTPRVTSFTYTLTFQGYTAPAITVTGP